MYLVYQPISLQIKTRFIGIRGLLLRVSAFLALYLVATLVLTPYLASKLGRVPLPRLEETRLKPANSFLWIANRNYVKPELKELLMQATGSLPQGVKIVYLDANFPFLDGFPMIGHLSHNDGEKIDLAFIYSNKSGDYLNRGKSFSGYGIVEEPISGEADQSEVCARQGFWQYSLSSDLTFYERHKDYKFDNDANKRLLVALATNAKTGKIFIEPHLESRLNLTAFSKVRFHGCHAARHDDHIHLQL